jgi:hypothetical protein
VDLGETTLVASNECVFKTVQNRFDWNDPKLINAIRMGTKSVPGKVYDSGNILKRVNANSKGRFTRTKRTTDENQNPGPGSYFQESKPAKGHKDLEEDVYSLKRQRRLGIE